MTFLILAGREDSYKLAKDREGLVSRDGYDIITTMMFEARTVEVGGR
jgi:hypothetical protein